MLKEKFIEVRFGLELWHYHFKKNFQIILFSHIKYTAGNFKAYKNSSITVYLLLGHPFMLARGNNADNNSEQQDIDFTNKVLEVQ